MRYYRVNQADDPMTREDGSVPLHRSYGVKRRLRPWQEKLELGFGKIILFWILGILTFVSSGTVIMFFLYFPEMWIKILLLLVFGFLLFLRLTRVMRKRGKFERRLRRICRKRGFRLSRRQNFFASLIWSGNRDDFVLETTDAKYFVRYLTIRKYRSTAYLESEKLIRLVKRPLKNKFTVIFDIVPRAKYYPLDFKVIENPASAEKRVVKAMILSPVCEEVFYKKSDGGYETTGNGGRHFGYTLFTGGGFLDTLVREAEMKRI
jgi:hypothetical protein